MESERAKMIDKCRLLFTNHKQATAFDDEYSQEVYDFLVKEGVINLTLEEKKTIFAQAKEIYSNELDARIMTEELGRSKQAMILKRLLRTGEMTETQRDYLVRLSVKIILKGHFDNVKSLEFKDNG